MITVKHVFSSVRIPISPMEPMQHVDVLKFAQYMNLLRIIQECVSVTALMDPLQMPM